LSSARDDFVLHVEEIGERLVEPLGPQMIARFGVDERPPRPIGARPLLPPHRRNRFTSIPDTRPLATLLQTQSMALSLGPARQVLWVAQYDDHARRRHQGPQRDFASLVDVRHLAQTQRSGRS
jgi:hypothetical protein